MEKSIRQLALAGLKIATTTSSEILETDYLVIGAGATGMAFVDEMIHHSRNKIILVDKRDRPGGYWVDTYDFDHLHQPPANYGVNSRPLGGRGSDRITKTQILAYYELVLADLLKTGRLKYYPQCEYRGQLLPAC